MTAPPDAPGVYFLVDGDGHILYIGKATSLRSRLGQHARAAAGSEWTRLQRVYGRVADVRWEVHANEEAAAAREADLVVALQPPANASLKSEGRWAYVVVEPGGISLSTDAVGGRAYGCFPHLGGGVSSKPGNACSAGYTALLRLLWAAGPGGRYPKAVTGAAPPALLPMMIDADVARSLHAFLSGTTPRLLDALAVDAPANVEPYMRTALARDLDSARAFFRFGPSAIRALRLRHRLPSGPMSRQTITSLLASEVPSAR